MSFCFFFFSVLFLFMWACEMTQQVKVLAGNLSMISGTYRTNSLKLSSTLQTLKGIRQKERERGRPAHLCVGIAHTQKDK